MGRIATWTDTFWARESSQVWRARGTEGGTRYVKIHQNTRFHHHKVNAYRSLVPRLGAAVYDFRGTTDTLEEDNHLLGLLRFKAGTGGQASNTSASGTTPSTRSCTKPSTSACPDAETTAASR